MNIYDFFRPSSPISAHLQSINYNFSPLERAVIICKSNKSLRVKHEAYRYIIAEYPDMPIPEVHGVSGVPSLHSFLREVILTEEDDIIFFLVEESDTFFLPALLDIDCHERTSSRFFGLYSTLEAALDAVPKHAWLEPDDDGYVIEIQKLYLNQEETRFARYTSSGEIAEVSTVEETYGPEQHYADYKNYFLPEPDWPPPTPSLLSFYPMFLENWTSDIAPFKKFLPFFGVKDIE